MDMPHASEPFHSHKPLSVALLHPSAQVPVRGSDGAGAFDLFMPRRGELRPGVPQLFGLGIAVAIPPGFVGLLVPRSSLGARYGLRLENTVGVIDSDYRGEVGAVLAIDRAPVGDNGVEPLAWRIGDRLIQLLIVPVLHAYFEAIAPGEVLEGTPRADGGFGSTGA